MSCKIMTWQGGKYRMAQKLNAALSVSHELFIEPFVGAGGMFLNKRLDGAKSIINDLDEGVYSLWRVLAGDDYKKFCDAFCDMEISVATFNSYLNQLKEGYPNKTEMEKALILYYLTVYSYNGGMRSLPYKNKQKEWNCRKDHAIARLEDNLEEAHSRAASASIYNRDGLCIISSYKDNRDALLYLDSPYVYELMGARKDLYNIPFPTEKQIKMIELVRGAKAKICISGYRGGSLLYDRYLNRDTGWHVYVLGDVTRSAGMYGATKGNKHNKAREFIWTNYELPANAAHIIDSADYALTLEEISFWDAKFST